VDNDQVIKIEGEGDAGRRDGKAGDLYVRVHVKPHSIFARKGDDLFISIPVTISQAALGAEVEVPTIEGKTVILKMPAGVEPKKVLRISGKGITHYQGFGRGDMYVELDVQVPKKLSRRQKELLEELRREGL